jgi:hypothetical protein
MGTTASIILCNTFRFESTDVDILATLRFGRSLIRRGSRVTGEDKAVQATMYLEMEDKGSTMMVGNVASSLVGAKPVLRQSKLAFPPKRYRQEQEEEVRITSVKLPLSQYFPRRTLMKLPPPSDS